MNQKRYWLRGGSVTLILAFIYWLYGAINLGFQNFNHVTVQWSVIFLVSATTIGVIIGWIFGKVKD